MNERIHAVRPRARHAIVALCLQAGCAPPPVGPIDLSIAFRDVWRQAGAGSDTELQASLRGALLATDRDAIAEAHETGLQTALTAAELEVLEFYTPEGTDTPSPDPDLALPGYLIDQYGCTIEALLPILTAPDQGAQYGSVRNGDNPYEAYSRSYRTDLGAFLDGTSATLAWEGELVTAIPLAGTYTYRFRADARMVPSPPELDLPEEHFLITRTWLPHPAEWEGDSRFDQDYQLEIFVPQEGGQVLHYYPVWRDWQTPLGGFDNGFVINTTLDQMVKWGESTEDLCALQD